MTKRQKSTAKANIIYRALAKGPWRAGPWRASPSHREMKHLPYTEAAALQLVSRNVETLLKSIRLDASEGNYEGATATEFQLFMLTLRAIEASKSSPFAPLAAKALESLEIKFPRL